MEQLRTIEQHKQLFGLLAHLNRIHLRQDLARSYSDGRTSKTSKLTVQECDELIQYLQDEAEKRIPTKQKKMMAKFFSICHRLGWERNDGKLDYARIENWLKKYSYLHKGINQYTEKELPKLITQIEKLLPNEKDESH